MRNTRMLVSPARPAIYPGPHSGRLFRRGVPGSSPGFILRPLYCSCCPAPTPLFPRLLPLHPSSSRSLPRPRSCGWTRCFAFPLSSGSPLYIYISTVKNKSTRPTALLVGSTHLYSWRPVYKHGTQSSSSSPSSPLSPTHFVPRGLAR